MTARHNHRQNPILPAIYFLCSRSWNGILKTLKIIYASKKQTLMKKTSPFVNLHLHSEASGASSSVYNQVFSFPYSQIKKKQAYHYGVDVRLALDGIDVRLALEENILTRIGRLGNLFSYNVTLF